MAVVPSSQGMDAVSSVMEKALQELNIIINQECEHTNPKIAMVLMIAFIQGSILQLKTKIENLSYSLGKEFISDIDEFIKNITAAMGVVENKYRNDFHFNRDTSLDNPDDLAVGIDFLVSKLSADIEKHMCKLPFILRNNETLFYGLGALVTNIFIDADNKNLEQFIDLFSENIRVFSNGRTEGNISTVIH